MQAHRPRLSLQEVLRVAEARRSRQERGRQRAAMASSRAGGPGPPSPPGGGRGGWREPFLSDEARRATLYQRAISNVEIDRVHAMLSRRDPARVIRTPPRWEVEEVAIYLHDWRDSFPVQHPIWSRIVEADPASRAIYYHEARELDIYRELGVQDLLGVTRPGSTYRTAHALASWREAEYWEAWASREGEMIAAAAFLRGHPLRPPRDITDILGRLRSGWRIDVVEVQAVELERARAFYRGKGLSLGVR